MKKIANFNIDFDGDRDTFLPGEVVRGKVVLDLQEALPFKGIRVKFKGKAEVTMFIGDYDTQKETYFSGSQMLFGIPPWEEGEYEELMPGRHEYPFSFLLPDQLPTTFSCEGDEYGFVSYSVSAIIQRPGKFSYLQKRTFKVNSPLDLNIFPDTWMEVKGENEKILSCLGFHSGTIQASFSIPRKGYVSGEQIRLFGNIDNLSTRRIKRSKVTLVQFITLKVYGSTTIQTNKICSCQRGSIPPGGNDKWNGDPLNIPDLPPSFLRGCELIDIQYAVKMEVVPSGFSRNMSILLDIIIGTVPLQAESEQIALLQKGLEPMYDYGTFV